MDVVGRDKELQFLNEAFDGDTLNVVSLRAWGGVGKSTLVNKWCEYLAADNFRGARRVFACGFAHRIHVRHLAWTFQKIRYQHKAVPGP